MRTIALALAVLACGCGGKSNPQDDAPPADDGPPIDVPPGNRASFFITSTGGPFGGDFRRAGDTDGLAGADEFCRTKAIAAIAGASAQTWRAYLSTATVNARDRIGAGPWFNVNGALIANSITELHDPALNKIDKTTGLDETGAVVPGRGDTPNQHDILTGSNADGTASANTCSNWSSQQPNGVSAVVGHHDRNGGGADPMSWSSAHATAGCSAGAFVSTGGRGSIYCFAAD
jgi:hypothetical protein